MKKRTQRRQRTNSAHNPSPPASDISRSTSSKNDLNANVLNDESGQQQSSPLPRTPVQRRGRPPPARLGPARTRPPPTAPATGGEVRRMRWSQTMNENVMRAYYGATEGGVIRTAYRDRMLLLFQELEPAVNVTAQRLSDQVRFIQRRHLVDEVALDRLRAEVLPTCTAPEPRPVSPVPCGVPMPLRDSPISPEDCVSMNVSTQDDERLRRTLECAVSEYRFCPMASRPRIPRLPMHRRNLALVGAVDRMLQEYLDTSNDLVDTHSLLYCGAVTVCRAARIKLLERDRTVRRNDNVPAWQSRIERRIATTRTLIAKLFCFKAGNTRPKVMRFVTQAFVGTGLKPCDYMSGVTERIDFLKQKVYAWASRIRRYRERTDRYFWNCKFQSDQKWVYRNWERVEPHMGDGARPNANAFTNFWHNIWSVPISHTEGGWIGVVERACEAIPNMGAINIEPIDVVCAIRSASNWKCPGPDGLHNFWIKWFRSSHSCLATQFQNALECGSLPAFLTTGSTHLLFKTGCTTEAKNYRPITCLPTLYKLLTSILSTKIMSHIAANNILAPTQNGCKAGSRGTKELLLVDMAVSQQVRRNRKNLSTAWIDYRKAYDSVPHTWLLRVLELYKVDSTLRTFLGSCMRQWNTLLRHPDSGEVFGEPIRIERGIFQGDSLSPLWFCLALNPLSTLLENSKLGYQFRKGFECMSHLLYMDDLKLFTSKKSDLMKLLNITHEFSSSIGMEFGVDKCAIMQVERGKVVCSDNIQLSQDVILRSLSENETYKYLGMSEALGFVDADIKHSLRERFLGRLTQVLKSLLSGGNKVRAFNGWVMPVLTYSFGILRWTQTELDALDRKVRKLLTTYRMHHPRSSVMRLYIPRKCGGRGFLNAKNLHNREICNLREYFLNSDRAMHKGVVAIDKGLTPLSLAKQNWQKPNVLSTSDRMIVWKGKELHGRFHRVLNGPDVDQLASVFWLRFGDLFGETEGFACAIADEVIKTRNYRRYILKDGTVDVCRACHRPGESIRHIVSGCSRLANGEYLHRHNQVARIIHQQLALKYGLLDNEVPYYQYIPQPVLERGHITLYWDRSIITDRTIVANKPDIVLIDRVARRAVILDVAIPHDDNLVKAEKDKLSKYLDLAHEVVAMWDVDSAITVPIVVSVNGLISKSFDQHLKKLSLDCWIKNRIQKAVILDTCRIVRRFLSLEP